MTIIQKGEPMSDLISRQAAIDVCNNAIDLWHGQLGEGIVIAVRKKIAELPSAHPEYRMDEWCTDCKEYDHERHCCPRFNHVIRTTLQEAQERKKGKWITHEVKSFDGCHTGRYFDECSECGKLTPEWRRITEYHGWDFCPNCGADMRGEQDG